MDDLSALGQLLDLKRIHEVKARYFRFVDLKLWDELAELFTDDARWAHGGASGSAAGVGGREFATWVKGTLEHAVSVHHGHMPEIEFTGAGSARALWPMYDWVEWSADSTIPEFAGRSLHGAGHYHEEYLKQADDSWKISAWDLTRIRVEWHPDRPTPTPGVSGS